MCVVSMVGTHYGEKWGRGTDEDFLRRFAQGQGSSSEMQQLRREVEELRKLLERAVEYDKRTNQVDCEDPDKIAFLIQAGDMVDVDLRGVFANE